MNFDDLGFKLSFQNQSTDPNFDANVDPKAKDKNQQRKILIHKNKKLHFYYLKITLKLK